MPHVVDRINLRHTLRHLVMSGLGLLALVLTLPASAQTIRATTSVDSVRVGERFTLSLVAEHGASTAAVFPDATTDADIFGDLVAITRTSVATRASGSSGVRIDSVAYEVTTFALDTARVPALSVQLVAEVDTVRAASTPLQIPIRSALPSDPQGLRGLAPLAAFPNARWPWVMLGLVALVLAGLAYYWYQRRTATADGASPAASTPHQPPYEAAQQRLHALEQTTDWNDPAALERFYVELSTTARTYVAHRLDIAALERTTGELARALRADAEELPPSAVDTLQDVLEEADLVKFADRHSDAQSAQAALQQARTALDAIENVIHTNETTPAAPAADPSSRT